GEPATDLLLAGGSGSMEQPRALEDEPVPVTPEAGSTVRCAVIGVFRGRAGISSVPGSRLRPLVPTGLGAGKSGVVKTPTGLEGELQVQSQQKSFAPKLPPRLDPSEAVPVHTRFVPGISCPNSSWESGSASAPSVRSVQLLAIVTPSVRLYGTVACVSRDAALVVELD